MNNLSAFILAFFLGFSSCLAQVVVLRELMAALSGNEFVFLLALAGWLVGVAAGSVFLRLRVIFLFGLTGVLIPATLLAARAARLVINVTPGQMVDPLVAAAVSFCMVLPLSLLLGGMFSALLRESRVSALRLYVAEAVGFFIGGLSVTFILLPFMEGLDIAVLAGLFHLVIWVMDNRPVWINLLAAFALLGVMVTDTLPGLVSRLRALSWPGFTVIGERDTVYGRAALVERAGKVSLFESGRLTATTGDDLSAEEAVQYALLAHPAPRRVLIAGGSLLGGSVTEALKHPGLKVDHIEQDFVMAQWVAQQAEAVRWALADPRLRMIYGDARQEIRMARGVYDVIIIDAGDPLTVLSNRFYTREFFREAASGLAPGGILSLTVTSSENYLNNEGRETLRSLSSTLSGVFADVRCIPGERTIFMAALVAGTIRLDPLVLSQRLNERGVATRFVRPGYMENRLDPARMLEQQRMLLRPGDINSDLKPGLFIAALAFWSTHFQAGFAGGLAIVKVWSWTLWLLPCLVGFVAFFFRFRERALPAVSAAVAGFQQMLSQAAVMLIFQSVFGYVYSWFGVITAVFMAGVCGGCLVAERLRGWGLNRVMFFSALVAVSGALAFPVLAGGNAAGFWGAVLFIFAFVSGLAGGAQFSAAAGLAGRDSAGKVYALDVLGSALGLIVGGVVLIPLWGVRPALLFCALLQVILIAAFILPAHPRAGKKVLP